ncbi:SDR family NAD(P)-dependent oxidoreductase [Acetobacteraceae bacterium H6797]|nr:SDR family NAD(P)-dependent oxidoreductase [Acetobacteraceae bacterium H6797]
MSRTVLVTGASRGLGAALARGLAGPGVSLALVARSEAALAEVAADCAARGATIRSAVLDVADGEALATQLLAWDAEAPFDLVIANAGISAGTHPDGSPETWEEASRQVRVNLLGAMATVGPLLPDLRARAAAGRPGQVALVASIAALRATPDIAGYAASKAGIWAWGEALRAAEAPRGIAVTVVAPGFFDSAMSRRWIGARPFMISTEAAAGIVLRAIERKAARCTFPALLVLGMRLLGLLPARLADVILRRFGNKVAPAP